MTVISQTNLLLSDTALSSAHEIFQAVLPLAQFQRCHVSQGVLRDRKIPGNSPECANHKTFFQNIYVFFNIINLLSEKCN